MTCAASNRIGSGSPDSAAASTSSHSSGVETVGRSRAQRVHRDGRLALGVLAPVDEHLSLAQLLGHPRHDLVRIHPLQELGDGLRVRLRRRVRGPAVERYRFVIDSSRASTSTCCCALAIAHIVPVAGGSRALV
jgi:hypothetical protein